MKGASQIAPFGLRMPEELKDKISESAKTNGRSMNAEIVSILEGHFFTQKAGGNEFLQVFREIRALDEARAKEYEEFFVENAKKDKPKE
ncbi:Arc family DNA-binding protein [Rahnella sp. LAC-M12]|uniref:Arc family DNA-binding protein n=1 Tax=Rahnella laticis TaxID=2787622 RepID=A0ABS0DZ34_9GAMM|nr:Arc family DNA-binding protein [Rahnella sp. LAC-M12]MBF7978129.1 Arc family DNA-binding protein [Rahnella laticis]MBF7998154.1 Arc family DNA-binding protein [Rahnella sp. LAC-M12]